MRELLIDLSDTLGSVKPLKAMAREDIADSLLRSQATELNIAMEKEVTSRETLRALQEPLLALDPVYTVGEQIVESLRRHEGLSRAQARQRAQCPPAPRMVPMPSTSRVSLHPDRFSFAFSTSGEEALFGALFPFRTTPCLL